MSQTPAAGGRHCLVMLDIDHFKSINDSYGHVMGDRVLQAVAEAIRSGVADPSHSVARYGGEEFAILLPRCNRVSALALAEACRQRVKALRIRDRRSQAVMLNVTISAGVAEMKREEDALSLFARADAALYEAKHAGRDRVFGASGTVHSLAVSGPRCATTFEPSIPTASSALQQGASSASSASTRS